MWLVGTSSVPGNLPFRLQVGEFVIGRIKSAQIVIADATVSRRHARLTSSHDELRLEDLESSNGTFVNECPVKVCPLRAGDIVRFGGVPCGISLSPLSLRLASEDETTYQIPIPSGDTTPVEGLTAAQQAIVAQVVKGHTETEIAGLLGKSPHTIHTHLKAIFLKCGVHSRAELIVKILSRQ